MENDKNNLDRVNLAAKIRREEIERAMTGDHLGEAFTRAGSQRAVGRAQRASNALLLGMGAGFKSHASKQKARQIAEDPIIAQADSLNRQIALLEAQTAQHQENRDKVRNILSATRRSMQGFAQAKFANDEVALNNIGKDIYNRYRDTMQDKMLGEFHKTDGDTIYFKNNETGLLTGVSLLDVIRSAEMPFEELYGEDAELIETALAPGTKEKYEKSRLDEARIVDKKDADIFKTQMEGKKLEHEINNRPESAQDKEFRTENTKYVAKLKKVVEEKTPDFMLKVLDRFEELITDNQKGIFSALGGGIWKKAMRLVKGKVLDDKALTEMRLLQKYFFSDIKGIAGNPNQKEWDDLTSRIVGAASNPDAMLKAIELDREKYHDMQDTYKATAQAVKDTNWVVHYSDPALEKEVFSLKDLYRQERENPEINQEGIMDLNSQNDTEIIDQQKEQNVPIMGEDNLNKNTQQENKFFGQKNPDKTNSRVEKKRKLYDNLLKRKYEV